MPCTIPYISPEQLEKMRLEEEQRRLQERRAKSLAKLEDELANGTARIEQDPFTGHMRIVGASKEAQPEGMSDLCVLDALQQRNSLAFQMAMGSNQQDFTAAHAYAHAHGHKH